MSASKLRLAGKVAVITGGASGIGEAASKLFASQGAAAVVIADIQEALGRSVAASAASCSYVRCDVRNEHDVAAAVDHAVRAHGRLDVMFSNAGVFGSTTGVLDLAAAEFDDVFAVNVRGTASAIKYAGRAMTSGGSIICTSSVAVVMGGIGPAAYTASKHALVGLAKAAASELGARGVRVNCVSPFGVATPLACRALGMGKAELEELISEAAVLKGRALRAADIAEAALFLASDESAFITGQNLIIDGGTTALNTSMEDSILRRLVAGGEADS